MFVNRISSGSNQIFRGYQQEKNNAGEFVLRFNHPSSRYGNCYVEFYNVKKDDANKTGYSVDTSKHSVYRAKIEEGGATVNLKDIKELKPNAPFAYRIISNGTPAIESGVNLGDNYVLVTPRTASPTVHGTGYFAMPDSLMPGAFYYPYDSSKTGEIGMNDDYQKDMENTVRTFSNTFGGNLAGMEKMIPTLKENGYKYFFTTPTAGGDNVSSHHYWTDNNKQIPEVLGNTENYKSFIRNMFKNGLVHVFDGTYTSEGLSGIHFQYALRWADQNPQTYYWFKMTGIKDAPLGFGTIPKNKENLRHRVINAPYIYDEAKNEVVENLKYDAGKETLFQIYDGSQVTDEQLELDAPIDTYKKIKNGNILECNSHNDTLVNYVFEIDPSEYKHQLLELKAFNKNNENPIKQNTPEGTILVAQFSNFKIDKKTEGGFVAWDANTDMAKKNCGISGYDEKLDMSIVDREERDYEKQMRIRGAFETRDLAIQDAVYWAQKYKDEQILYVAKTLKGADTVEQLRKLVDNGEIPKEALLSQESLSNIINGIYHYDQTSPKLDRDNATVRALMKLPLDSLEVGHNTQGVLSTSFFSNYATKEEQIGMSRFELLQNDNPHLVEPYSKNYTKVNDLFTNEIKNFADEIVRKLNEKSDEKLLDENDEFTEYGEYVIDMIGQDIAKYAFLKALRGEGLKAKILPDGEITYDYHDIKTNTSLAELGVKEPTPQTEAAKLENVIEKGLTNLSEADVDFVTESVSKRLAGTTFKDFAIAKAMVEKSGLGLAFRLDASKDVIDMDAIRNGEMDFDDAWDDVINFWKKWVEEVKKVNPNAYIVAEITDVEDLMKDTLGLDQNVYNESHQEKKYQNVLAAMMKFFAETGVTSEAAYSYFFTDMLKAFSVNFEDGLSRGTNLAQKFNELRNDRSVDYVRNLYTFAGNHDKPRLLHGLSLDMTLFHGNGLDSEYVNRTLQIVGPNHDRRYAIAQIMCNAKDMTEMPIEVALNIDNPSYYINTEIPFSTKSIAMSSAIRNALGKVGTISAQDMELLNEATRDLANGNFLGKGSNLDLRRIKEPALSSIEGAVEKLLQIAKENGFEISEDKIQEIARNVYQNANTPDNLGKYIVRGDFDWGAENTAFGQVLVKRLEKIFTNESGVITEHDYMKYSPYVANLMALVRDSFEECGYNNDNALMNAFANAQREFVRMYDRKTVEGLKSAATTTEDFKTAMQREAFGTRDVKTAIEMVIEQANYLAKQQGKKEIQNPDDILYQTYKSITEPAVQKACAYMAFLSAITGISTMYAGDEFGMSGYDEKAKNVFLQNRNTLPMSIKNKAKKSALDDYILSIESRMNAAMSTRNRAGIGAINDGTLYEASTGNSDMPAILMQNAEGDVAVTVLNAANTDSEQNQTIEGIELIGAAALPVGYVFVNSVIGDKLKYEVFESNGKRVIKRQDGKRIAFNENTAPNRVMVLGLEMKVEADRAKEAEEIAKRAQATAKKAVTEVVETAKENVKPENERKIEDVAASVADKVKKGNKKAWALAAGAVAIAGIGYGFYKHNKQKDSKKDLNVVG